VRLWRSGKEKPPVNGPANGEPSSGPKALGSWKEIADYLGVAVRTAQKWEVERNLPVLHLPGPKGRVSADPAELERWRQLVVQRPAWHRRVGFLRVYALAVTALLVAVGSLEVTRQLAADRPGAPTSFRIDLNALTVVDDNGRTLWTRTFPEPLLGVYYGPGALALFRRAWIGDIDHDGARETLFSYRPAAAGGAPAFLAFSDDGEEAWRFLPGDRVKDGQPLSPLVEIQDFDVADLDGDGSSEIVLTVNHPAIEEAQIAVLDAKGHLRAEYWAAGRLDHVAAGDLDGSRAPEIYAAGTNPRYGGAVLTVLDAQTLLRGTAGVERATAVFPRTDLNRLLEDTNRAGRLAFNGSSIQVVVRERLRDPTVSISYTLNGSLQVTGVEVSEQFRSHHRELEAARQLDHSLSEAEISGLRAVRIVGGPATW